MDVPIDPLIDPPVDTTQQLFSRQFLRASGTYLAQKCAERGKVTLVFHPAVKNKLFREFLTQAVLHVFRSFVLKNE